MSISAIFHQLVWMIASSKAQMIPHKKLTKHSLD